MIHRMGKNLSQENRLIHKSKKEKRRHGIRLTKKMKDLLYEDLKTGKKEIEDDTNDRKTSHAHGPGKPILCK